ncbi:toll-like receptor 6 [Anopheles maculipalpis]|uniref:toll-like receptor 6 n=1 Tax=Anopheles maculipalpis TaxID=1496333 RepID=UPI00215984D5|nr:toll-like receptor 6 [Anopheles maculipalpis]
MKWISCTVTVVVLWVTAVSTGGTLCDSDGVICRISNLNITSSPEAFTLLAQQPSSVTTYTSVMIQQLIMGSTTIADLLINASTITNSVLFKKFHEKNIFLPRKVTLEALTVQEARNLQTFIIPTNKHLKQLEITHCAVSIVPPAFRNLVSLKELRLKLCSIKTLNLALLATLRHLETVQLIGNNITTIYPPQSALAANIRTVDLSYNQLRRIDMSVLRSLKLMQTLNLEHNQLSTVDYRPGEVVTLPRLTTLRLSNNKLERISFEQLNATSLEYLVLSSNRFITVPEYLQNFPNLALLALDNNLLESFDFSILQSLGNLQWLELHDNHLASVVLPKEIDLPYLHQLLLANNRLQSVNLEQLYAPRLSLLDLRNNLLTTIPNVFEKGIEQLESVNVVDNPLTCGTYETYRKYIHLGMIVPKWVLQNADLCSTGTYFTLTETQRVCCLV